MKEFLSVNEASQYFKERGISIKPGTLRRKVQKKAIPFYKLEEHGRPKFKISDLDKYIESKRVRAEKWPSRRRAL